MMNTVPITKTIALTGFLAFSCLIGCSESDAIRQYTVPREGLPSEILGAIVPQSDEAWFFKLMGEPKKVDRYRQDFRQLVSSLSFAADGQPKWDLPAKWREEAGGQFTFMSLLPPNEESLKVTVSKLAMPSPQTQPDESIWREYVVRNVNRWRGQLQLSEQSWDEMVDQLEPLERLSAPKARAYFVSLQGQATPGGMSGMGGPDSASRSSSANTPGSAPAATPQLPSNSGASLPEIKYALPENWREVAPLSVIALGSFEADGPNGSKASATFTSASGDRVSNVARWNGQVKGAEDQVAKALESSEKLTVNGADVEVVKLVGSGTDSQAITVAIVQWNSQNSLFVKLWGPAPAVESQHAAFIALVKSLSW